MKNFKIFSLLLLASGLILTSCGDDEPSGALAIFPLDLNISVDTVYALPGHDAMIPYNASPSTNSQFTELVVTEQLLSYSDTVSYAGETVVDSVYGFSIPASAMIGDTYIVSLRMSDNVGATDLETVVVITTGTAIPAEHSGSIYHRFGLEAGAFDLVNNVPRLVGDPNADKDMENNSMAGEDFSAGFVALNNTLFFQVTGNPDFYANANTAEAVIEECESQVGVVSIPNPAVGDVIIIQLRNMSHAVMRIEAIDPADGAGGNTGRMDFVYKKPV